MTRILIVDDDKLHRFIMRRVLDELDAKKQWKCHEADGVDSGLGALRDLAKSSGPILVICDYVMSGQTGVDFIRLAHEEGLEQEVTFVLFTSLVQTADHKKALDAGARLVVNKPLGLDAFHDALGSMIEAWQKHQSERAIPA